MVSADPRASSLTADFRVSSALPWTLQPGLPPVLPAHVVRGGPGPGQGLPGLLDEDGNGLADETGNLLS